MAFELEAPFNTPKWKAVYIRAEIMAMMLNGTLDWNLGCAMRNLDDETIIQGIEEEMEKYNGL